MGTAQKEPNKMIQDIIVAFNNVKDYYELLSLILTKMMELTNADGGTLYVVEEGKLHFRIMKTLSIGYFQGARDKACQPPIVLDASNIVNVSAYAAIKNEIIVIDDVYNDSRFNFEGPKAYDIAHDYKTRSILVIPLTATNLEEEEVIGVIQLINAIDRGTGLPTVFREINNPPILPALASMSANALANIVYTQEIKEMFNSFARVMSAAIDERSPYKSAHTKRVANFSDLFARYLNRRFPKDHPYYFSDYRREQLVMAAFLHDIGKIITPLEILDKSEHLGKRMEVIRCRFDLKKLQLQNALLKNEISSGDFEEIIEECNKALALIEKANKAFSLSDEEAANLRQAASLNYIDRNGLSVPIMSEDDMEAITVRKGNLTAAEWEIMKEHVSVTERLLTSMRFNKYYKDVPKWAAKHHEFLDGSGYPKGLRARDIPTEVCILTIMDIYEALTSGSRPYKEAVPPEEAMDILFDMAKEGKLSKELVILFKESEIWTQNSQL